MRFKRTSFTSTHAWVASHSTEKGMSLHWSKI